MAASESEPTARATLEPTRRIIRLDRGGGRLLSNACDFYSRWAGGQFDRLVEQWGLGIAVSDRHEMEGRLRSLAREIYPDLDGARPGIYSDVISDHPRRAYDLHQVLRRRLAWLRSPEGGLTVDFDPVLPTAGEEPAIWARDGGLHLTVRQAQSACLALDAQHAAWRAEPDVLCDSWTLGQRTASGPATSVLDRALGDLLEGRPNAPPDEAVELIVLRARMTALTLP